MMEVSLSKWTLSELTQLNASCPESEISGITWMRVMASQTSFQFIDIQGETEALVIPVGYELISTRFFKHTPPTPDELEYAINYIEDEYEKLFPKINHQSVLYTTDLAIRHIAELCYIPGQSVVRLPRESMESLFGLFAEVMLGRPSEFDAADTSAVGYAQLLILRECLYHLKFDHISSVLL
ncbi:hypothetical protein [Celerinatantimonas sp. YJH-8]|uniref:hypothetical protein n=1 Tax=Celerinatantimonas sp. YJH-8 TaxID=3228714 RepID=UPI0038BEEB32